MLQFLHDKNNKNRFFIISGSILIIAGLLIVGYNQWERLQAEKVQNELRREFEDDRQTDEEWTAAGLETWEKLEGITFSEWQPTRLVIPEIDLDLIILSGDVFDMSLLAKAPVHYQMSDFPSTESGNVAIAGHRGGRMDFFLNLDFLELGDKMYLESGDYVFVYEIDVIKIIEPDDWSVISSTEEPVLTLTTCEPKWKKDATHRLVVRGSLIHAYDYNY